jgi:Amt family ammonium transporter
MLQVQELKLAEAVGAVVEVVESASISAVDTAWMITATAFVLFMTLPGLSL